MSSKTTTWCTPHDVLTVVEEFDRIALDPCGSRASVVKAHRQYLIEDGEDGLILPWASLSFVNCPYGRVLGDWAAKTSREWIDREVESILLVPARTDTAWWRTAIEHATAVCFWSGRITFHGAPSPAPFPSALVYHGERDRRFARVFGGVGWVVRP